MTAPTTEERRKGERRVSIPSSGKTYVRAISSGFEQSMDMRIRIDRRATERERAQKHYGAMLEDSWDLIDARRYRWLRAQGDISIAACWLLPVEHVRSNAKPPPEKIIKTPEDLDAAIDAEILKGAKP